MLDINFIIEHKKEVEKAVKHKKVDLDLTKLLALHKKRAELLKTIETLQQSRNEHTKMIKEAGGKPSSEMIAEGKRIKDEIAAKEPALRKAEDEYHAMMLRVPNVYSDDTPVGKDESGNKVLRTFGTPPRFAFKPREHWELGESLGVLNITKAAEVSGSRFNYLLGDLARMEFALIQFTLSVLTDRGLLSKIASQARLAVSTTPFIPVVPPVLVRPGIMERMGRLEPRDEKYHTEKDDLYLVGSAEHTLGPLHMDEIFEEQKLPIRYIGFSTAFRRESGSYGKDVKGILRVHQFDKLEMECFTTPETGASEQEFIVAIQEYLVQQLGLPHQVVSVCTGDMGAPDFRQIDIETWMPGQDRYRETHTSDFMTDYQSRRLNTKVRRSDGSLAYVYMNDATAFAIGRTLIAVMENYQQEDGSIRIPDVLQQYLSGKKLITRNDP